MTLAGLYRASVITRVEEWSDDRHIGLRDTFRLILESDCFPIEVGVLQMAAAEVLPRGRDGTRSLINELEGLARAVIRQEFLPTMAKFFGVPSQRLHLKTVGVQRRGKDFSTEALHLDRPGRPLGATEAARALWRSLDPERDYDRIDDVAGRTVAVIDVETGDGWWRARRAAILRRLRPSLSLCLDGSGD